MCLDVIEVFKFFQRSDWNKGQGLIQFHDISKTIPGFLTSVECTTDGRRVYRVQPYSHDCISYHIHYSLEKALSSKGTHSVEMTHSSQRTRSSQRTHYPEKTHNGSLERNDPLERNGSLEKNHSLKNNCSSENNRSESNRSSERNRSSETHFLKKKHYSERNSIERNHSSKSSGSTKKEQSGDKSHCSEKSYSSRRYHSLKRSYSSEKNSSLERNHSSERKHSTKRDCSTQKDAFLERKHSEFHSVSLGKCFACNLARSRAWKWGVTGEDIIHCQKCKNRKRSQQVKGKGYSLTSRKGHSLTSQEELVQRIKIYIEGYNASGQHGTFIENRIMFNIIRPRYGYQNFRNLGFGNLTEFLTQHGLCYPCSASTKCKFITSNEKEYDEHKLKCFYVAKKKTMKKRKKLAIKENLKKGKTSFHQVIVLSSEDDEENEENEENEPIEKGIWMHKSEPIVSSEDDDDYEENYFILYAEGILDDIVEQIVSAEAAGNTLADIVEQIVSAEDAGNTEENNAVLCHKTVEKVATIHVVYIDSSDDDNNCTENNAIS